MVSFSCGNCNETLKKNKVDAHCMGRCRSAEYVSCIDCGVDFYGDDYQSHTSCISEAQKYGGKDWVAKDSSDKGLRKQEDWVSRVQDAINNADANDPKVKDILDNISTYSNIPQKKHKFLNFLKNSFPRYRNSQYVYEKVWDLVENVKMKKSVTPTSNGSSVEQPGAELSHEKKNSKRKADCDGITEEEIEAVREAKRKKREDKVHPLQENMERLNDTLEEQERSSKDFNWEKLILGTLEKKHEISLKKLRKKAVSEFVACGRYMKSEEKVWKKLDKKLRSLDNVLVQNDRVSLKDNS